MEETAVYVNCAPNRAVHPRGEKKVSIMVGGGCSARFTLGVSVAMDGSKLPFLSYSRVFMEAMSKNDCSRYYLMV